MEIVSLSTIQTWDRFYRGNFISSLSGYKSASLIGTGNQVGITNLAIFSNIVHIGADPALIGFINRPREAAPHTLANIESTGSYTINHIHPAIIAQAHLTSAKYPEGVSEFTETGLTLQWLDGCKAPFVKESFCGYGLELVEVIPIKYNQTFLVIGAITMVKYDAVILQNDGFLNLHKIESVASLGIDAYYKPIPLARYEYAKPGKVSSEIEGFIP
jgi:flavin reductase (DIM6/NTAB) family NADH-FMN oxidoreductase RutF